AAGGPGALEPDPGGAGWRGRAAGGGGGGGQRVRGAAVLNRDTHRVHERARGGDREQRRTVAAVRRDAWNVRREARVHVDSAVSDYVHPRVRSAAVPVGAVAARQAEVVRTVGSDLVALPDAVRDEHRVRAAVEL